MEAIKNKLRELEALMNEYPLKLPLVKVAEFLGMNEDGLKAALVRGNVPFGFGYQKADNGYRVFVIPSVPFYCWYTNTTGQMLLATDFIK